MYQHYVVSGLRSIDTDPSVSTDTLRGGLHRITWKSLAWGSAAILFSGTQADSEPKLIKWGGCCVLVGLIAMSFGFPRGLLWVVMAQCDRH